MSSKLGDIKVIHVAPGITSPTAAVTADVTGPAVDLITSDARCFAIQVVGSITGVAVGLAGKMQESPSTTAGNFVDIPGATFTPLAGLSTGVGGLQAIAFTRTQRYVRYVGDMTGTTLISGTTTTVLAIALDVVIGDQKKQV